MKKFIIFATFFVLICPLFAETTFFNFGDVTEDILMVESNSSQKTFEESKLFALKVKGDSMIDVGIFDGDYVIIEQRSYAENGEIVVCLVDDEATVKRFFKENGAYRLQPENKSMQPIIVNEVSVLGKVAALIRYYA